MTRTSKTVYYAHAMCTYGCPREEQELAFLHASFPGYRIVNPAQFQQQDMEFYRDLVSSASGVVFSRLFGKITAGVGDEVNHAICLGKPVFELIAWNPEFPDWELRAITRRVRFLDRDASVALYRRFERG